MELKFTDGSTISIDCTAVEREVARNMYERSELDYLIFNDPLAYAELILNGDTVNLIRACSIQRINISIRRVICSRSGDIQLMMQHGCRQRWNGKRYQNTFLDSIRLVGAIRTDRELVFESNWNARMDKEWLLFLPGGWYILVEKSN